MSANCNRTGPTPGGPELHRTPYNDRRGPNNDGGPAWIRTKDQGIHVIEAFPPRVDYLFTLPVSN